MKYKLTDISKTLECGTVVYRIQALKSWEVQGFPVRVGDLGGWVQHEGNLSQSGGCWLFDDACSFRNAERCGESIGDQNSRQSGNSQQSENSWQSGYDNQERGECRSGLVLKLVSNCGIDWIKKIILKNWRI